MISLKKILPGILKVTDVWPEFMEVVTSEMERAQLEVEKKKNFMNIDDYETIEDVLSLARSLGFSPNLLIDDSLEYAKKETKDIVFKIKKKATYYYYDYIFRSIGRLGFTYILFKDQTKLVRAINQTNLVNKLAVHDVSEPFLDTDPIYHFFRYIEESISLDDDPLYYLDSPAVWYLDQSIVIKSTKHIAVEYVIDQLVEEDSTEYLLTPRYFQFLRQSVNYGRKVTEFPHIGAQLTLITSTTGYYNYGHSSDSYGIPALKASSSVTDNFVLNDLSIFYKIKAGIGAQTQSSETEGSPTYVTSLDQEIYEQLLSQENQIFRAGGYTIIVFWIPSATINNEIIATGDGTTDTFTGTLGYTNIVPSTLIFEYTSSPEDITATTNKFGEIVGDKTSGTINYETGAYTLYTYKEIFREKETIATDTITSISGYTTGFPEITPNTFRLYYYFGSTLYEATDDGIGNITGTNINSGTINYTTGELNVTFSSGTDAGQEVYCKYNYRVFSIPDNLADIKVKYRTNENIEITEVGIENNSGDLVAYGTFPPIKFSGPNDHLSIQFAIKDA